MFFLEEDRVRALVDGEVFTFVQNAEQPELLELQNSEGRSLAVVNLQPQVDRFQDADVWISRLRVGVQVERLAEPLAVHLDLKPASALQVLQVESELPAAEAGLRQYDVITHIDGATGAVS